MGRVSRYKKIKSIDPFYKGPKRDVDKGWNLPPKKGSDSQSISRSFRDFLMFSQTTLENTNKNTNHAQNDFKSEVTTAGKQKRRKKRKKVELEEEKEKNDNLEEEDETSSVESLEYKRVPGESNEHYLLRVDYETNQKLMSAHKKVKTTSTRRKEYLKKRKLKSKLKKSGIRLDDIEGMDFEDLQDHVKFGEVVSAPPSLSSKKIKRERNGLLLNDKVKPEGPQQVSKGSQQEGLIIGGLKKQQDIAEEREKVIGLYRQVKKQKQRS